MNTERTFRAFLVSRTLNLRAAFAWLAALLLLGLAATASQAGMRPVSPAGTGAVLALAAQLHAARVQAAAQASSHTSGGRTLLPHRLMHSGALRSRVGTSSVVPISGGVQTYDVANPAPAFRPLIGFGAFPAADGTGLNNSSTNPPVYISSLTPTNLTPVWSADETFLVFSSNRTLAGGINADGTSGGSRFHLWAISVNGGEAFQITKSTGPDGGGEFFPALSRNNLSIAFTSDAASPGTQNLYALAFSYSALSSGTVLPTALTTASPAPLTLRASTEGASAALTGFDQVVRPTFSPNDDQLLVFSAHSISGTNLGHYHVYFLYASSGGFSPGNNVSFPGKLTDGPADDTDPAYAPDGSYIAFASTATGFTRNPNNPFGPPNPASPQDPNASQSLSGGAAATRSVFLISGGLSSTGVPFGTVPGVLSGTGGRISLGSSAGLDDSGPAWSSFANQNQYTNPSGQFAYLAFARGGSQAANHDIYYFQAITGVASPSTEAITPETAAGNGNAGIKLNTDDNAGETSTSGNFYNDLYPTWSPFLSIFSISYMSNRTVTYNNPSGGVPVEVAASVADSGTATNALDSTANYSVGAAYEGLFVSQVLNLDPPTLLRFSANEVVHVQSAGALNGSGSSADPVNGTPNKLAVTGGQKVTLTVRLSDREAGIADAGGPNGGPRVYVQLKDPDGKYDDARFAEHKVFAKDARYFGQPNQPLSDITSNQIDRNISNNSALAYFSGPTLLGYGNNPGVGFTAANKFIYPSYMDGSDKVGTVVVGFVNPRGAHGGHYFAPDTNDPSSTYIFVGKGAAGTTNTATVTNPGTNGGAATTTTLPGTDPNQFVPQGPEYEAQVVNPQFAANGTGDAQIGDPTVTVAYPGGYFSNNGTRVGLASGAVGDYITPYWLAGIDDQGAFSGGTYTANTAANTLPRLPLTAQPPFGVTTPNGTTQTDRPTAGYTTAGSSVDGVSTTTAHPAEWLQLAKSPVQDGNGGVLYTITWATPASGSDFYVDVIAYDNAVFPNFPNSAYTGKKTNWRIYDNVGGFSTNQSIGGNDILLVSDYALGQKFAATTFGGRNLNLNLVPKIFGTESYLSAVDTNILPDSVYAGIPTAPDSYQFNPAIQALIYQSGQNGLGFGSYVDGTINQNGTSNGPQSQAYSIWRILSRGPVPASLLQSYAPTPVSQPAIADAADPAFANIPAATILEAQKCVIWLSPYTGDVLADPGTIDDPGNVGASGVTNPRQSTTAILTNFVKSGGRLFITGQDIGSTLTQGGTVNNAPSLTSTPNFLPDVLNATLTSNNSGVNVLAAANNRITGSPFYDNTPVNIFGNYLSINGPIQGPTLPVTSLPYQDNLVLGDADFSDSGLSQIPAVALPGGASVQGQQDAITAIPSAITAATYGAGGPGAIVFHDDPYNAANTGVLPNGGTGSRVVYAAFGLEALSQDYYASASPNPSQNPAYDELIPQVIARNPRSAILHNIVSYLRTGRISGTITQTSGTGQGGGLGIDGVTVYLRPSGGAPPSRAAFSALTANGGRFTIFGVEPGTYTLVAIKPGFQRATSNNNVGFTVEGDVALTGASLSLTPQQPGSIAGAVLDTLKQPIDGATVTFTSQDNSVVTTKQTINGSVTGSMTENYFIQNVPVTTYTGTATGPNNPNGQPEYTSATKPDAPTPPATTPDFSKGVAVLPNTTTQPVNFTLTPILASVTGKVTSGTGGVVGGAKVTLTDSSGKVVIPAVTTATDGTYTLANIPTTAAGGTYTITATAPGFIAGTLSETLYLGSVLTGQNIALTAIASGTLTGTVTDQGTGQPVAGATVTFTQTGAAALTATTGADGTYTLTLAPLGTYSAVASGPATGQAYQTSPAQTATVTAGAKTTTNFALVAIRSTLTGTVTDASTGRPLAGVTITVSDASKNAVVTNPAAITTDASGNYTATLTPGTYFVTASKASYTSQTSAATAFALGASVAVPFKLVSSIGTVGGLVTDQNGSGLVSGAAVTFVATGQTSGISFSTSGSSSNGPDSKPQNYTGQLAQGTYTVKVTLGTRVSAAQTVTVQGGAFTRLDFAAAAGLPTLHTFASGLQFVSTPYDYSSLGFSGLFGALNTAPAGTASNGNRSNVAVWNPLTGAYALDPNAPADTLRLGVGYWVYLKSAVPVTQQGATTSAAYIPVALGQGWNQIGVPNAAGLPVSGLMFDTGQGTMITYQQAGTSQYNLVSTARPLYGYSGGSYQALGTGGVLQPWNAYWIYVNAPVTLEIPTK